MADNGFVKIVTRLQTYVCMLWVSDQAVAMYKAMYILYCQQPRTESTAVYAITAMMVGMAFALLLGLVMLWCRVTVVSIQVAAWTWPSLPSLRAFKQAVETKSFDGQRMFAGALDLPYGQMLVVAAIAAVVFCLAPQTMDLMSMVFRWMEIAMAVTMLCIVVKSTLPAGEPRA